MKTNVRGRHWKEHDAFRGIESRDNSPTGAFVNSWSSIRLNSWLEQRFALKEISLPLKYVSELDIFIVGNVAVTIVRVTR